MKIIQYTIEHLHNNKLRNNGPIKLNCLRMELNSEKSENEI